MVGIISRLYSRLVLGYKLPPVSRNDEEFYKKAIELGRQAYMKDRSNDRIYFKIVPECQVANFLNYGEDRIEYRVRLRVFSSPRIGLLNKIPDRIHKIKDIDQVVMIVKDVCEKKIPDANTSLYNPFEFMKQFSMSCVIDQADEIRSRVIYKKEIIHPFNLALPPAGRRA
jgi:hypothetical protein